jgi:hypothetical protein
VVAHGWCDMAETLGKVAPRHRVETGQWQAAAVVVLATAGLLVLLAGAAWWHRAGQPTCRRSRVVHRQAAIGSVAVAVAEGRGGVVRLVLVCEEWQP